jgi:hypothetical protein
MKLGEPADGLIVPAVNLAAILCNARNLFALLTITLLRDFPPGRSGLGVF